MKKLFIALILLILVFLITIALLVKDDGLFSPKKIPHSPLASDEQKEPKRIIGFLPYWQLNAVSNQTFSSLNETIYFGLKTDATGEIAQDEAYAKLPKVSRLTKVTLAIVLQNNEEIESFIKEKTAQEKLVSSVSTLITQYSLPGINLDFEYSGIPGRDTIAGYSAFVADFARVLKEHHPNLTFSVDITADAMKKSRLYDVEQIAKVSDYVILMGYDFYRPTSSVAGPVAPLSGKELYEYDVTTAVADFLTVVPKEKLILGVPYYGWDFPTVDGQRGSFVEKRPREAVALASYKRIRQLIEAGNVDLRFDEESQTPWLIYRDPDTNGIRQVWFEDEASLAKKYDLVNTEGLAGIAIWALGYDGPHSDLWELLGEKFIRE